MSVVQAFAAGVCHQEPRGTTSVLELDHRGLHAGSAAYQLCGLSGRGNREGMAPLPWLL